MIYIVWSLCVCTDCTLSSILLAIWGLVFTSYICLHFLVLVFGEVYQVWLQSQCWSWYGGGFCHIYHFVWYFSDPLNFMVGGFAKYTEPETFAVKSESIFYFYDRNHTTSDIFYENLLLSSIYWIFNMWSEINNWWCYMRQYFCMVWGYPGFTWQFTDIM